MLDTETGEMVERRLEHENGEARSFYESLPPGARVGMEATAQALWFERLLMELGHELWVGEAAQIRAMVVRQQIQPRLAASIAFWAVLCFALLSQSRFPRPFLPRTAS
jgi:transposase